MVPDRLMERMGSEPNLSVRQPVTIGTMLKLNGDENGNGNGMCKQAFKFNLN